jgi:hypothetical protein
MNIALTNYEMKLAGFVAVQRVADNLKDKLQPRWGQTANLWQAMIEGTIAEYAVAKALDICWDGGVGTFKSPDAGPLQVRHTERLNGKMLLHPSDKDHEICVLVVGNYGNYTLQGWAVIGEVKLQEYWLDPTGGRPCYFVPREALRPMEDLRSIINESR